MNCPVTEIRESHWSGGTTLLNKPNGTICQIYVQTFPQQTMSVISIMYLISEAIIID